MSVCPSAVLLELIRDEVSVITRHVDERPLSALLAAVLNSQPDLATECMGLTAGQEFDDGTNRQPDVMGYRPGRQVTSLVEVKTGSNRFNWSETDNRNQLQVYREANDVGPGDRILVLPAARAEKISAGIKNGRQGDANVPYDEIAENWRMVTWQEVAAWLVANGQDDSRVEPMLPVLHTLLRVW